MNPAYAPTAGNVARELAPLFQRLAWCGDTIDLNQIAAKTFQGYDCYGRGKPPRGRYW